MCKYFNMKTISLQTLGYPLLEPFAIFFYIQSDLGQSNLGI